MKAERFLDAMNDLPDELIQQARPTWRVKTRRRLLRTVLIAAVFAMLLSVTAYATGESRACYQTSLRPGSSWSSLRYLPKVEKKLGLKLTVPEQFDNGFTFEKMELSYTNRRDDDGVVVETFPTLSVRYTQGGHVVSMGAEAERPQPHNGSWETREYEGVTIWSHSFTYKAVPEDYQETEQDKDLQASGELMIGWGSDRIVILPSSFAQFTLDGVGYHLLNMDGVEEEVLCAMAEEIIRQ